LPENSDQQIEKKYRRDEQIDSEKYRCRPFVAHDLGPVGVQRFCLSHRLTRNIANRSSWNTSYAFRYAA